MLRRIIDAYINVGVIVGGMLIGFMCLVVSIAPIALAMTYSAWWLLSGFVAPPVYTAAWLYFDWAYEKFWKEYL